MNVTKVGLMAVVAAGGMAAAIAHSAATGPKPVKPAKPAKAASSSAPAAESPKMPAAPAPAPAAPAMMPAAGAPAAATAAGPAGKAEIKETMFDAGTVERGADVAHAFVIKNVGKYDLTVDAKPG
jgi:hypothetical protein